MKLLTLISWPLSQVLGSKPVAVPVPLETLVQELPAAYRFLSVRGHGGPGAGGGVRSRAACVWPQGVSPTQRPHAPCVCRPES